jgi:hypothetical protein
MQQKVKVKADKNGNVVRVYEDNPEYGYIRVEQDVFEINSKGWLGSKTRSARIQGKIEDLKKASYVDGTLIPGKIVIIESLQAFNPENPDRDLKIAGKTGVICRMEDQPIYRQTFFTPNQNAFDELITHTNADEIRDVINAQKLMEEFQANNEETEEAEEAEF